MGYRRHYTSYLKALVKKWCVRYHEPPIRFDVQSTARSTTHEGLKTGEHRNRLPDSTALVSSEERIGGATAAPPPAPPAVASCSPPPLPLLLPMRRLTPAEPLLLLLATAVFVGVDLRDSLLARDAGGCISPKSGSTRVAVGTASIPYSYAVNAAVLCLCHAVRYHHRCGATKGPRKCTVYFLPPTWPPARHSKNCPTAGSTSSKARCASGSSVHRDGVEYPSPAEDVMKRSRPEYSSPRSRSPSPSPDARRCVCSC